MFILKKLWMLWLSMVWIWMCTSHDVSAWLFFLSLYNVNVIHCVYSIFHVEGHLRCGEGAVWGGLWGEQWQSFRLSEHRKQQQRHHSRGQERKVDAKRYCALNTGSFLTLCVSPHLLCQELGTQAWLQIISTKIQSSFEFLSDSRKVVQKSFR